jgi:hypothetical protein
MNEHNRTITPMPDWLLARCIAVAAELERMHGPEFAAEFLNDIGATAQFHSNMPTAQETHQYMS